MQLSETTRVQPDLDIHQLAVLNYCRRRTNFDEAEDATAEVMAIAWRRRGALPTDHLLPYLYGIAFKVLANQRRTRQRQARVIHRSHIETADSAENIVIASQDRDRVLDGLHALSQSDQEILRLAAWEQLSRTEISQALGLSKNAVTKRFNRALDHLATELGATRMPGAQFFKRSTP